MPSPSHESTPVPARPARPARPGWLPVIDAARCTGCGWCVAACGLHLLSLEVVQWRKTSTLHDAGQCTGCSDCAVVCPFRVISMRKGTSDRGG
ncbi:4Fe-4S dicluster domain-containing protein [Variovorax robiniae]|uniref:4Fe-4S dicluster domain-containing protein n=2 Tax=Variovorax robiniae TaxID=1836199 RepID=A0ABU8XE94_9BURK